MGLRGDAGIVRHGLRNKADIGSEASHRQPSLMRLSRHAPLEAAISGPSTVICLHQRWSPIVGRPGARSAIIDE